MAASGKMLLLKQSGMSKVEGGETVTEILVLLLNGIIGIVLNL